MQTNKPQTTEEMIKEFKATSLGEPSETSTDIAQPVKAELSAHFFLKVSWSFKYLLFLAWPKCTKPNHLGKGSDQIFVGLIYQQAQT